MLSSVKKIAPLLILFVAAGCNVLGGGADAPVTAAPAPATAVADSSTLIGAPYSIGGRTYTPSDAVDYDEVGYASWYGVELEGRPTANGEAFRAGWVTAAHRTLPIPSYVEVTRLDTGRTILVRVNDRGPADERRLIDLSAAAAEQLGIAGNGLVQVRVRRTNPVQAERLALRSGGMVPARLDTPDSLLSILRERAARLPVPSNYRPPAPVQASGGATPPAPSPSVRPAVPPPAVVPQPASPAPSAPPAATVPVAEQGPFLVQIGAFSARSRADALARRFGARVNASGGIYRVQLGPYASRAEAEAMVEQVRRRGQPGAVVQRAQ